MTQHRYSSQEMNSIFKETKNSTILNIKFLVFSYTPFLKQSMIL